MSEASNMIWDAIYNLQKGAKNTEQQVQPDNGTQERCKKDADGHCAFYPLDCKTCVMPLPVN